MPSHVKISFTVLLVISYTFFEMNNVNLQEIEMNNVNLQATLL